MARQQQLMISCAFSADNNAIVCLPPLSDCPHFYSHFFFCHICTFWFIFYGASPLWHFPLVVWLPLSFMGGSCATLPVGNWRFTHATWPQFGMRTPWRMANTWRQDASIWRPLESETRPQPEYRIWSHAKDKGIGIWPAFRPRSPSFFVHEMNENYCKFFSHIFPYFPCLPISIARFQAAVAVKKKESLTLYI